MADTAEPVDLSRPGHVHVVGVGGAGMSAIAAVLTWMGHTVTGSDLRESPALDRLRALGVDVQVGHRAENVGDAGWITCSTAIPESNPEVRAATERGLPVLRRAEVLAAIAARRRTIAVAGTHGKTTTASLLALALVDAGMQPGFIIGGDLHELGGGAVWSDGDWFVVEADESDGTFLALPRQVAVVTNVEPDHLEHYGGVAALETAFERFVADTPGPVVLCADDAGSARLAAVARSGSCLTYGTSPAADLRMTGIERSGTGSRFTVERDGEAIAQVALPLPGLHNARNAAGALAAAVALGADVDAIVHALARFGGVARRFETRGEVGGVTFVDDYAHLPSEVAAALDAASDGTWRRVVCVFQPHRYSRTQSLWKDFADAFTSADLVAVTSVYGAGEAVRPGVTGKLVVNAVLDAHPHQRTAWLPHRADLVHYLLAELRPGDLCLTLGAGDLTTLPDELMARLRVAA